MSTRSQKTQATAAAAEAEPVHQLLDEWLRIENEHANPGLILPGREAIVAWSEQHAMAVLVSAGAAIWIPVLGAITFG